VLHQSTRSVFYDVGDVIVQTHVQPRAVQDVRAYHAGHDLLFGYLASAGVDTTERIPFSDP
jgi:hypothetical protein